MCRPTHGAYLRGGSHWFKESFTVLNPKLVERCDWIQRKTPEIQRPLEILSGLSSYDYVYLSLGIPEL